MTALLNPVSSNQDGHFLLKLAPNLIYSVIGDCHQYFCLRGERVVACDGTGWVAQAGETHINQSVTNTIRRMLSNSEKRRQ